MKRILLLIMLTGTQFTGILFAQKNESVECEIQNLKCIQGKLQIGETVDLNRKNSIGRTTLHYAVEANDLELIKLIITNNKSIVGIEDKQGNTSLHRAVALNRRQIVEYILPFDNDINKVDRNGETILDLATNSGYTELADLLINKGVESKKGNKLNLMLFVYGIYICLSIAITIWVARTLSKNGRIFLIDAFLNQELADSVNHLLVVGFYLINLGYITIALKIGHKPTNYVEAFETLSTKVGLVILILGVMHFFNLYLFGRLRKRTLLKKELIATEKLAVVKPTL